MTKRFFLGLTGGKKGGRKSSDMFMETIKKGSKPGKKPPTPQERYKKLFDEKMAAMMKEVTSGGNKGFILPGTQKTEKKVSAAVKHMMEQIAEKKAKRENKKFKEELVIQAKSFSGMQGGRIDSKGNIYNAHNQIVATVNLKTHKIVNKTGVTIGKYVPDSPGCEYLIAKYITKTNQTATRGNVGLWDSMSSPGHGTTTPVEDMWGTTGKKDGDGWW